MKWLAATVLVLLLSACSNTQRPDNALDRPRLAAVPAARTVLQRPRLQAVQGVSDGLIKTIEAYWLLLEALPDRELEALVLRRLGDLLVEQGEQSLQAIDLLAEREAPVLGEEALAGDARLQALYRLSEDSYHGAVSVYEQLIKAYPQHPLSAEALYQKARSHESLGEPDLALEALQRLSREFPANPRRAEIDFRRGELLFQAERFSDASRAYTDVLRSGPDGPFRDQALYKQGWAEFKDKRYAAALLAFFTLLDKHLQGRANGVQALANLNVGLREQLEDTLRAAYLSFSNQDGPVSAGRFLDRNGARSYEDILYRRLGEYYLEQQRYTDSAQAFLAYAARHPGSDDAPRFHLLAIGAYEAGGFGQRTREAKQGFAETYRADQAYWRERDRTALSGVVQQLRQVRAELARFHHARAQSAAAKAAEAEFKLAERWYREFSADPGEGADAAGVVFLFGELLYERRQYVEAVGVYERAAYEFGSYEKAGEAAYAAIIAYDAAEKSMDASERTAWQKRTTASARRFAARFPTHQQLPAVLTRAAQAELRLGNLAGAESVALKVVERVPPASPELRQIAWSVIGHSAFEQGQFDRAERSYGEALALTAVDHQNYVPLRERLAAAIYQQGEQARVGGDSARAAALFQRVGQVVPDASIRASADYDAAAAYILAEAWQPAILVLEDFQSRFPKHELAADVGVKLALAYDRSGSTAQAAGQYEKLGRQTSRPADLRNEMLRTAASLFDKAGDRPASGRVWAYYLSQFPQPLGPAQEARWTLAELARESKDERQQRRWLGEIIDAHRRGRPGADPRLAYLAAQSTWLLAQRSLQAFEAVRLVAPLDRNLARKRQQMEKALTDLGGAAEFGVAEVTTVATYQIAEVYRQFSRALMESERPANLSELEREQYSLLLEEQAFPFEEKSIDLHVLNLSRVQDGLFDQWIEKSRAELARLVPVRYARTERSIGYVETLE